MIKKRFKGITMRCNKTICERGIETIEWIAMAAVILTLLAGMLTMATPMGRDVATSMVGKISQWVARWGGEGSPVAGGSPPGGQYSPGSGPRGGSSPGSVTGPSVAVPQLIGQSVHPVGGSAGQTGGSGRGATPVSYTRTDTYVKDANGNWVRDPSVPDNGRWEKSASLEASVGTYTAEGGTEFGQGSASAHGKVGVYAAKVNAGASAEYRGRGYRVGGEAKGEAWVGAEAQGKAGVKVSWEGVEAEAGGEVFVGGKAEATGELHGEVAGIKGAVQGKAAVSYGIGAKANFKAGYREGEISLKAELGATLGLGVDLGVDVNVDVGAAADKVVDWGKSGVRAGKEALEKLKFW